jgi:histidine triad (HIT) family protein
MNKSKCVFCQLQQTEAVFYRDKLCYAVLDLNEVTKGHTLLIPVKHYENMLSTPEKVIAHMYIVANRISKRLIQIFNADGVNVITSSGKAAMQDVMHFHIHIIPRYNGMGNAIEFHYLDSKLKNLQDKEKRLKVLKRLFMRSKAKG